MKTKAELIQELVQLHKEQRAWQIMLYAEELNTESLWGLSVEELHGFVTKLKEELK